MGISSFKEQYKDREMSNEDTIIKQKTWTHFWDLRIGICSGSEQDWLHVYIEAPKEEAKKIFQSRFGYIPDKSTCIYLWDYSMIEKYEEVGDTFPDVAVL